MRDVTKCQCSENAELQKFHNLLKSDARLGR